MEANLEINIIESKTFQDIFSSVFNVIIMKQDIIQEQYLMEMVVLKLNTTLQLKK